jgi:hypothetical protein
LLEHADDQICDLLAESGVLLIVVVAIVLIALWGRLVLGLALFLRLRASGGILAAFGRGLGLFFRLGLGPIRA